MGRGAQRGARTRLQSAVTTKHSLRNRGINHSNIKDQDCNRKLTDVGMGTTDARICALTSSVRSTGGGGGCGRGSGGEPAPPATLDASAGAQPHAGALVR